jgi:hypothetical protein
MTNSVRIKDLAISETGFVFDPFSGGTFTVNGTGQAIIKALRDGLTAQEIIDRLAVDFDRTSYALWMASAYSLSSSV